MGRPRKLPSRDEAQALNRALLDAAENHVGGTSALAEQLGLTRSAISHMRRRGWVRPLYYADIERVTDGEVKATSWLHPDQHRMRA